MSEEIILDDVNVAECRHLSFVEETYCCDCQYEKYASCERTNCYYKQLKRLQAENEELKKRRITKNGFICDCEQNEKYRQALEEIKNLAELEVTLNKNSKALYPANIQRILDVINEVLNEQ